MKPHSFLYKEVFSEPLSVKHKVTGTTEKRTFHLHSDLEIIYAISNNLIFCTEEDRRPIPAGSLVLLNSMSLHQIDYVRDSGPCDRYVLFFKPELLTGFDSAEVNLMGCFVPQSQGAVFLRVPEDALPVLLTLLQEMVSACAEYEAPNGQKSAYDQHILFLTMKLMLCRTLILCNQLYREQIGVPNSSNYEAHSRLVMEICKYIDLNCAEVITIDGLARRFLISKTQLFTMFKEVVKMSAGDYISHARLTKAKDYLINTDYSVEIISQAVGYANIASFSRVFKEKVGLSPLQYRKQQRM